MSVVDRLLAGIVGRSPPIDDEKRLADFLDSRAAFLAQKCVVEFCRVRSGVYWQKLFSEQEFREKLTMSCWRSYPPAVAMLCEMIEGTLRPSAGLAQRKLPQGLEAIARSVFERHPLPQGVSGEFWAEADLLVKERLASTQADAPRPVRKMAEPMARLIHSALPIHQTLVSHDYDYIRNNLRMNLLRAHEDFVKAADMKALSRVLVG